MIYFEPSKQAVWIFRKEPLNLEVINARVNMSKKRLHRHLPEFEELVEKLVREQRPSTHSTSWQTEKVTPSHDLGKLFDMLKRGFPREVVNAVLPYQPHYADLLSEDVPKSALVSLVNEVLYDFALYIARNH